MTNIFELWQEFRQHQVTVINAFSVPNDEAQFDSVEAEVAAYERFKHAMDAATKQYFTKTIKTITITTDADPAITREFIELWQKVVTNTEATKQSSFSAAIIGPTGPKSR